MQLQSLLQLFFGASPPAHVYLWLVEMHLDKIEFCVSSILLGALKAAKPTLK